MFGNGGYYANLGPSSPVASWATVITATTAAALIVCSSGYLLVPHHNSMRSPLFLLDIAEADIQCPFSRSSPSTPPNQA